MGKYLLVVAYKSPKSSNLYYGGKYILLYFRFPKYSNIKR